MSLRSTARHPILSAVKYTGLLIMIGGAALSLSFRFLKQARVRPSLGPVSEQ